MTAKNPKTRLAEDLAIWRKKHFAELEKNLTTAISVRDNTDATDRDRNEAIKTISRLLGGLQSDRVQAGKDPRDTKPFTDTEEAEIQARVKSILDE